MLNRTESPINKLNRDMININWSLIETRLISLQRQVNIISGNVDIDVIVSSLQDAINEANAAVSRIQEDSAQSLSDVNVALTNLNNRLSDVNEAIQLSEVATNNANDATRDANEVTSMINNLLINMSYKGEYSSSVRYQPNNFVLYQRSTYVSLVNQTGVTPNNDGVNWRLLAGAGVNGSGAVNTVNNNLPDGNGNVELDVLTNEDLRDYFVNVKNFGAVGNGVTNDTQSFLNAIASLTNKSGTFYVPSGTYLTSPDLVFDGFSNLNIEFAEGASILCRESGSPNPPVIKILNCKFSSLKGVNINGNGLAWYGIDIEKSSFVTLDRISINNTLVNTPDRGDGTGIRVIESQNCEIKNSLFQDIGGDGVLTLGSDHILIDNCVSERCLRHNYAFGEPISTFCTLQNSIGRDSHLSGIDLETGQFCKILNNEFYNNGNYQPTAGGVDSLLSGIVLFAESYSNLISGNIINNPNKFGIWVVQPSNAARTVDGKVRTVSDIIRDNIIRGASDAGIYLSANQNQDNKNNAYIVSSNIIEDCSTGIRTGYATSHIDISNNQIYRCTTGLMMSPIYFLTATSNKFINVQQGIVSLSVINNSVISNNIIELNETFAGFRSYAISITNGNYPLQSVVISNNVTNADVSYNQSIVFIESLSSTNDVYLAGNVSKNGTPDSNFLFIFPETMTFKNTTLQYGIFGYSLLNKRWNINNKEVVNTNKRPTETRAGDSAYDVDLGIPIWYNGVSWINSRGENV